MAGCAASLHGAADFTVPGGGSVTGSASHDTLVPTLAFDDAGDVEASRWLALQSELPNVFIQYDFGVPVKVRHYTVQSQHFNFSPRAPKDWKLQGSNDGTAWVDVDTVSGEANWTEWETRGFAVDDPDHYQHYKLLISAANGADTYIGIGEIELGISQADLRPAIWAVSHLTGDADSLVDSELQYTCAVNVHGTEDKVVNGVTFVAESGTSGTGWEITENFQTQHNGQGSTVTGMIGEVLSNRMRFNGDPQKLKMKNLVPGETYIFSIYNQAWGVGETRTATLSLDAAAETIFVNQGQFASEAQDGQLVQCTYMALGSEVEFTVDPDTNATWHLYGFSNSLSNPLLPIFYTDETDPTAQVATLEWQGDVTEFTIDDIQLTNATASNFQEVDAQKHTFTLTPDANNVAVSVRIEAATLKIGGVDNELFSKSFLHSFETVPTLQIDATDPTAQVVTLEWEADVTEFTVDDLVLADATASNFQEVDARTHTFTLTPESHNATISINIPAATLLVGGEDNGAFSHEFPHYFHTFAPLDTPLSFFTEEVGKAPVVWFDAGDVATITGNSPVTKWADKSGNGRHAEGPVGAPTYNATGGRWDSPVVEIRKAGGDDYLQVGGDPFFAKEHYYVFRSADAADRWDYYGGVLGHQSGRGSNYLFENNNRNFHGNQSPEAVQQNGLATTGNVQLSQVNQFMLLRIAVNDNSTDPKSNYRIGFSDGFCTSIDIAEVIAFDSILSNTGRLKVEGYLARKWGLLDRIPQDHAFRSEPPTITLNGDSTIRLPMGTAFTDPGATATDPEDGDISGDIVVTYQSPPAEPQAFAVDTYPGLQLWLKADEGFAPGSWTDHSNNAQDATAHGDPPPELIDDAQNGLPVMRYSGADGQYHSFSNFTDIRTVFWVLKRNTGPAFILGDDNLFHFHSNWGVIFNNQYTPAQIKDGRVAINGAIVNAGAVNVPTEMAVLSLRTTGNVEASNFSNDRNIAGRYWNGDLAELLIFNTALNDIEVADVEARLGKKWGLPYSKVSLQADSLDSTVLGDWTLTYSVTDSQDGPASVQRTVHVFDPDAPVLTLVGGEEIHHELNTDYTDRGYTVVDASGGDLDITKVTVKGTVDPTVTGTYILEYNFTDDQGRPAVTQYRTVNVADSLPPVITLVGGETVKHPLGQPFIEPGFSATDLVDGEVEAFSSIYEPGIRHQGFLIGAGDELLDFEGNGGLLQREPVGEAVFTGQLHLPDDNAFMNAGVGINRADNFNNLFTGVFKAKVAGTYEFQISGRDDRGSFWVDLNRNGEFESEGSAGNEWMNRGYFEGNTAVQLSPGFYPFAIGHTEHGGGSRIQAVFKTPEGAGPSNPAFIHPASPAQAGLWWIEHPVNTGVVGSQTITYTATDAVGNVSTVTRTIEMIDASAIPVITLLGRAIMKHEQYADFADPGFTVADADGNALDASGVVVTGHFDSNVAGTYELVYTFFDQNQIPAEAKKRIVEVRDTIAPTLTIEGDAAIEHVQGTAFTDPGATIGTDPEEGLFVVSTAHFPLDGITIHVDAGKTPGFVPGDVLPIWSDISGNGHHFTDVRGDPLLVADGIGGLPSVRIDGDDFLAVTHHVDRKYSIISVTRWDGVTRGRIIGSRDRNWLFGYWNGREDAFHPEGWVSGYHTLGTTHPHIYSATSTGGNSVKFYGDGRDLTITPNRNGLIGKLQVGGNGESGEPASGDVSEILVFKDYVLPEDQRRSLVGQLAVKYGLMGFPQHVLPDLTKVGEHTIHYMVRDSAGNVGFASRTVTVTPDPSIPIITLTGEAKHHHEASTDFTDPGATVKDGDGNDLDASGIVVTGSVNSAVPGTYELKYNFSTPDDKHADEVIRIVTVSDTEPPEITLTGEALVRLQVGADYTDAGATATDVHDGALTLYTNLGFPSDGLVLHLDAGSLARDLAHGETLTSWPDISGAGNHADNTKDDPKWLEGVLNGRAVVNFDGNDMVWTTKNFEADLANYTLLSIARYTGGDNERVISARARNFLFGFHGGSVRRFFSDGWASSHYAHDLEWHLHFGTANNQDQANFWVDTLQLANNHNGLHNTNYKPDQLQLGGFGDQHDMSKCEVAELMLYDRVVTTEERTTIYDTLYTKYGLGGKGGFAYVDIDTSEPGTHTIEYTFRDNAGNQDKLTRTVIVSADNTQPYIVMNGDVTTSIQAGSIAQYVDPGATAKAQDGSDLDTGLTGTGDIDLLTPGTYTLTYNYTDADPAIRTIHIVDTVGPEITLVGEDPLRLFVDAPFADPGATSVDMRDGDRPVYSDYVVIPDSLRMEYHIQGSNIANLYLEDNGGVLALPPFRTFYISDGPQGEGIHFFGDQDFNNFIGFTRWDAYQVIFSGELDARRDGDYGFSTSKRDGNDYCTLWIDRDKDGLLEKAGDLGDEQLLWDNQTSSIFLTQGKYPVYIGYSEWNGASRFNVQFHTPEGVGPFSLTTVHPGGPGQEGLWSTIPRTIDTSEPGEHTITYFADDSLGNRTTLTRTVIVEEDTQKPVILLLGNKSVEHHAGFPFNEPGYLLDDYQGNPLDETQVVVTGTPDGQTLGTFTITYSFTDADGHMAEPQTRTVTVQDIVPPVITINGTNPTTVQLGTDYVDAGAVAVDALDGSVPVISTIVFDKEGLVLHLDASSFKGTLNHGDAITIPWADLSGQGNHADNQVGDPTWIENGPNGQPVVNFDGDDVIWTTKDFEPDLAKYSIFTVARYTGGANNRVISSRGRNWLFGFHGNTIRRFFSDGWGWNQGGADTNWHIHIGDVNDQDQMNFWLDGAHLAKNSAGLHDVNYKPQEINLGGYNDVNERSKCEVAELILFDRVLPDDERFLIELYLKSKYNLNGGGDLFFKPIDTSTPGEYVVDYKATDNNGNTSIVTRTVIVANQTNPPVITLTGEPEVTHPTGQAYIDEGATVADSLGVPLDASQFIINDGVNTDVPGEYAYAYDYTDADGNIATTAFRTVLVTDQTPPVVTLVGGDTILHQLGNKFTEPGYSATDVVDGDIHVESSMLKVNRYRVRGYMFTYDEAQVNLDGNGGILLNDPVGERTDLDQVAYFNGDGAFRAVMKPITRNDHFQFVIDGHFHTENGGRYEFGVEQPDDRAGFWVDLDRDGVFEAEGDKGSELMNAGFQFGYREVDLLPGYYKYTLAYTENTGGSRIDPRYRAIIGEGPGIRTRIEPRSPAQQGHWTIYNPVDVLAPGEHTITYTATDAAGNVGTAIRTVTVRNNPDAGRITLTGDEVMTVGLDSTYTEPGATITDIDGNVLSQDNLVITGTVDTSKLGEYTLDYNYTTDGGIPSRTKTRTVLVADQEPPLITLTGDAEVTIFQGAVYADEGATATDNLHGEFVFLGSSQDFPTDGLFTHLDASAIGGKVDGDPVTLWYDSSPAGNNADNFTGAPAYATDSINGRPAVRFDGSSLLSLGNEVSEKFTILTVSKVNTATPQRFLSSRDRNWFLGYHLGRQHRMHVPNGWVTSTDIPATQDPQLYSATSGDLRTRFSANGRDLTATSTRRDGNYWMGYFQMGGWADNQEATPGDVAEVIIYNRILSNKERMGIEARLNAKYGLNGVDSVTAPVDTRKLGEYHVVYQAVDSAGNLATAMRKVTVVKDPNAPTITLNGEGYLVHEAGETFTDPGAVLTDAQGGAMDNSLIEVTNDLVANVPGQYTFTYSYTPDTGSPATPVIRTVQVEDTQGPVITLNGPEVVKLAVGATYTEEGASATDQASGDRQAFSRIELTHGQLGHAGFMESSNDALLNFGNEGGLLALTPVGTSFLTNGPANRGLNFDGDGDFRAAVPEITRNDHFQNLFTGYFFAQSTGSHGFHVVHRDDRATVWIDLDQDGQFEADGDKGNEQLSTAAQTHAVSVNLNKGPYRIAMGHMEHGGGSGCEIRFQAAGSGWQVIQPSTQTFYWATKHDPVLDTSQPGTFNIEYFSYDAAGNLSTATRTVTVVADATIPFIALEGGLEVEHELGAAFTDPLAKVTDDADQVLKSDLAGVGTVDVDTLGTYTLTYDYTHTDGKVAEQVTRTVHVVDTTAPAVTINPHPATGGTSTVELTVGDTWEDPGIDITDADTGAWFVSSRDYIPNRLFHAGFQGNINNPNFADFENGGGFLGMTPNGSATFTTGPSGKGFDYANEADFRRSPIGITDNDWFGSYVMGYFHARVQGDYTFQSDGDYHMAIWLDLDQDGIFGISERLTWGADDLTIDATLNPGYYLFAGVHLENNGATYGKISVQTPAGAGPSDGLEILTPVAPAQAGLWNRLGDGPIDTTFPGTHTITYYAFDTSGHLSKATRTVVVNEDPDAPVLTRVGDEEIQHQVGTDYTEIRPTIAKADGTPIDDQANIAVTVSGSGALVDQDSPGTYHIQYDYTDGTGRKAIPVLQTVIVGDFLAPVITLLGDNPYHLTPGYAYIEAGATSLDTIDGDLEVTLPPLDFSTASETTLHLEYTVTDAAGNTGTAIRELIIQDDPNRSVIILTDGKTLTYEAGEPFVDPGFTFTNGRGHDLDEAEVTITGDVDHTILDTYTLEYSADGASTIRREVTVVDTTPPVISLTDGDKIRWDIGKEWVEPGATVTDNLDTGLVPEIRFIAEGIQPVVHWQFDETEGTTAFDLMAGLNGTLRNFPDPAAARVQGKYGNALSFEGVNSSYVDIPGSATLDLQAYTLSVWVKSDDYNRSMFIFEKSANDTVNSQYNLFFESDNTLIHRVIDDTANMYNQPVSSAANFVPDVWHHIAVTYDGKDQLIFIEGSLVATASPEVTLATNPNGKSYIGAYAPGDGYFYTGLIDDLKIYDFAITESQVPEVSKRTGVDTATEKKIPPYTLSYSVTDSEGNSTTVERKIVVSNDITAPVITLSGNAEMEVNLDTDFTDPGASATDNQEGDMSAFVEVDGSVDTAKVGAYTLTYTLSDFSFNEAEPVTRTVTVVDPNASDDPLAVWTADKLASVPAEKRDPEADPDHDRVPNLLEYAIGGNPTSPDRKDTLPEATSQAGSLKVTFLRVKASVDPSLTYKVELTRKLKNATWSEADVTVTIDADQTGVPADYKKVTATSNTPIASETQGRQFIRITVERP